MSTHSPEVVERVKAAIRAKAREIDGEIPVGTGRWFEALAEACLDAVDALYDDEGDEA